LVKSENSPIRVTIAIPTFNRADRYLRSAIESALAQSASVIEIIVADNCSTDQTPEIVASYEDDRLIYVRHEKNMGANDNFNFCIKKATGDYFLLLPDDDLIDPGMIEACVRAARGRKDYGVIRTGTRLLDGESEVLRKFPNTADGLCYEDFWRGWLNGDFTSYVCSTLLNTRLLKDLGGLQSRNALAQDLMAIAKLIARGGHCDVVEIMAGFRRHETNFGSGAEMQAWCEDWLQLAETLGAEAPENGQDLHRYAKLKLCKRMYEKTDAYVHSWPERVKAYRMINEAFDRCYSPWRYLVAHSLDRGYRAIRRKVRRSIRRVLGRSG